MAKRATRFMAATDFHRSIGTVIDDVARGKATVIVTSHGRPQFALMPADEYEELLDERRMLAMTRPADRPADEGGDDRGPV